MAARTRVALALVVVTASAIGAAALATLVARDADGGRATREGAVAVSSPAGPVSALEALERRLDGVPGSRRDVGEFVLGRGRVLRLHTIETADGGTCVIDDEAGVALGSVCLEEGLESRHVAFSINSNGGPARFRELYLVGVAAPGVASVVLIRSDGSATDLSLGERNAFLYEASAAELARDVLPSRLDVYARGGALLESLDIPGGGRMR